PLRPLVIRALQTDPDEKVRAEAITALASLDFSIVASEVQMSAATQKLLIERFYVDRSAKVRAKIIGGLGSDEGVETAAVRKLLADAFRDTDYRVRHAAMSGVQKLDRDTAISLVVKQLADQKREVRAQAAS